MFNLMIDILLYFNFKHNIVLSLCKMQTFIHINMHNYLDDIFQYNIKLYDYVIDFENKF